MPAVMLLSFVLLAPAQEAAKPASFEAVVDAAVLASLSEFEVPGIAVGVVKDGKLVFAKGYGVRKLGDPAPVTPHTVFGIASHTKAFTAAALAILVDEGKIGWDDPVVKHLPNFQLYDPYVTREITIRDLLCHRCGLGLGAGDLMFFPPADFSRDDILKRLRYVKPAHGFREKYAYCNVAFLAAGQIVPAVTGKSWDDFVIERIFKPLGMNASNTSVTRHKPSDNVAMPHAKEDKTLVSLPFAPLDNNAPAGSINSSVNDVSKWVVAQLQRGALPKGRLFSAKQCDEMWKAHTPIPIPEAKDAPPGTAPKFSAYGLGWVTNDYRGRKLVWHTGGLAGMVTRITLVPEESLGVIVLTNQEMGGAFGAVTHTVLDWHLKSPGVDWVKLFGERRKKAEARAAETIAKATAQRNAASKPSLPLAKYAGRWRDAWYGDVAIDESAGKLAIRFTHSPELVGVLEHWQYDTFVAKWHKRSLLADAYITFTLDENGAPVEAKMKAVSPLTDFSFDFHDLLLKPAPKSGPAM